MLEGQVDHQAGDSVRRLPVSPELSAEIDFVRGDFALRVGFRSSGARILGVYGASGAGKSTLLHIWAGLLQPRSGFLKFGSRLLYSRQSDSFSVRSAFARSFRGKRAEINLAPAMRRVGYVFQDTRVFPHLNVRRNVLYGAAKPDSIDGPPHSYFSPERILDVLNLSEIWTRPGDQLSGGQQKRVAIARALVSQPDLLLCDEAGAGLDAESRRKFLLYLSKLPESVRAIYVSHDLAELARLTDEILLLDRGRLVYQGNFSGLLRDADSRDVLAREGAVPPVVLRRNQMESHLFDRSDIRISDAYRAAPADAVFILKPEHIHLVVSGSVSELNTSFPDQWPGRLLGFIRSGTELCARVVLFDSGPECIIPLSGVDVNEPAWQPGEPVMCMIDPLALQKL